MSVGAEVSVAFAGFAGLITAVRKPDDLTRTDATGLALIVWCSLSVMFIALGVMALFSLGVPEPTVWRVTSGTICVTFTGGFVFAISTLRSRIFRQVRNVTLLVLGWLFPTFNLVINAMNVFGWYFEHVADPVVISGFFILLMAAYYFARLLLDPVWSQASRNRRRQNT